MKEKMAERIVRYQCDAPTTREERRQIRARARAAARERFMNEEAAKAEVRHAEIKSAVPRQRRKAA